MQDSIQHVVLDATNKKLGRLASEAAAYLNGKKTTDFAKNKVARVRVTIENASKLALTEKKQEQKLYSKYSGYPGGLTKTRMEEVIEKKGHSEIVKRAIYGMLPTNKLRKERMKHLIVTE